MKEQLLSNLNKLLKETETLVIASSPGEGRFVNTLLGIYRISFFTVRDIVHLSSNRDSSLSILDLSRKILEYAIAIEYMIMKGKEEYATKFQDYLNVEAHNEIHFFSSIGQDPLKTEIYPEGVTEIENEYSKFNTKIKQSHSWSGNNLEQQIKSLYDGKFLSDFDNSRLAQIYVWACRANHPSPFIVKGYLEDEGKEILDIFCLNLALVSVISFYIRLTQRYIDEIRALKVGDEYGELVNNIKLIWEEVNALKLD